MYVCYNSYQLDCMVAMVYFFISKNYIAYIFYGYEYHVYKLRIQKKSRSIMNGFLLDITVSFT